MQDFLKAFESGALSQFPHRDHIRMAWLYLRRDGWEQGLQQITGGIQRFAAAKGAAAKYHETITVFWAHVVQYAITQESEIADFDAFVAAYPHLLDASIIKRHYSHAVLWSEAARQQWVEPDLKPLPMNTAR